MRLSDLTSEALLSLSTRPWRTATTAMGTVLGVAALVGIVGLASTAQRQVSDEFDLLQATEVLGSIFGDFEAYEAEERLGSQPGVLAAAVFETGGLTTIGTVSADSTALDDVNVVRATGGFHEARELSLRWGRWFDAGHAFRKDRVVVLGASVADSLGVIGVAGQGNMIWLDGVAHTVIGVVERSPRMPLLINSVAVPYPADGSSVGQSSFVVLTDLGDAPGVSEAIGYVPVPGKPDSVSVVRPPEPGRFVEAIRTDIQRLVLGAAGVALIAGVLGIATVTSVSVVERTPEMGLRLALGAKRRHITGQVALEAALTGMWGGFLGSAVGVAIVVAGAAINDWRPFLPPQVVAAGPIIGLAIGGVAGIIPAYRTSRIQPDRALRTE
ncbi:MAG: ABC transporter permease [Actinobacteria bacterium]|nr:ABC transporter permease [Actinomycetota bacterium]